MALLVPDFLQTKTYNALRFRQALAHFAAIQEGVWDVNDLKVVQRAAGANMSVDVGSGFALVNADDPSNRGLYHEENDATVNVTVTASNGSNPRIDQIILQINDSTHGGDITDTPALSVLTGTATTGATLDNRTGAAALPTGCLRLADVLVPAASSSVVTANIRDRRLWARGAYWRGTRGTNFVTASGFVPIDSTLLAPRIEMAGIPTVIRFHSSSWLTVANSNYTIRVRDDIAFTDYLRASSASGVAMSGTLETPYTPTAGSRTFSTDVLPAGGGTVTFQAPIVLEVMEIVRPNASNT